MKILDRKRLAILAGVAVLVGLYVTSRHNYLLFHSLAEIFSIAVAGGIFMVAWNSRRFLENNYVLFIGVAFLFIAFIDLIHLLSYKGMSIFPGYGTNTPTQLWIAARYMEGITLLVAPFFIGRKKRVGTVFAAYAAVSALLVASIFYWKVFPDCFIEGSGLTPFKKTSEYVISFMLAASIYSLYRKREAFDGGVLRLLYAAILTTVASELAFTFYVNAYGFSNLAGHYLKILSFFLIYKAIVETGLREPYNLLFRDLKRSEEKYHSLFTEMLDGFAYNKVVTDDSGKPIDYVFLEVNDAFEKLTGLKKNEIIGKKVTEVLPGIERDPADWIGVFGKVALTGEGARFEQYAEALGRWYSVSAYSPQRGYFSVIFEEVTERKKADGALRSAVVESLTRKAEVEALLSGARSVLEHRDFKPAARAIFDSCKNLIGATAGYVALLSKDGTENEVLFLDPGGLPCTVDPSLPMPVRGLRGEAYRTGRVVYDNDFKGGEWKKFMPEGHAELENVLFAPLVIEGRVVGLMGIANKEGGFTENDASLVAAFGELAAVSLHNSLVLEHLGESEERFRSLAQSANDSIISGDQYGNIVFWNRAATDVFGYSAGEAMGKPLSMIMPEAHREAHKNALARAVSMGRLAKAGRTAEFMGLRKDGTEFPVELSVSEWTTGGDVFFTAIVRDITERKRAEEELRRHREKLEEMVLERTGELIKANEELEQEIAEHERAEAQLLQSQKMEAVGQLAGGIAHDFNNRLFAIRNYAFILKTTSSDEKAVENAERILASCDKAAKLVDDLLRFSRKKEINPRPADLNNIVREARGLLEIAAGKAVELHTELSDKPLAVMADSVQMEHVLLNLVNNARDIMSEGGRITIETGVAEAESIPAAVFNDGGHSGSYAFVSVSDTGPGMDRGTMERIFEPFFTTKEVGKGTGLGLSSVYGTVKQHGGHIDVESELGKGTTFTIFIPRI